MDMLVLVALLVALGYLILYLRSRMYLSDGFQDSGRNCQTVLDTSLDDLKPYVTNQDKYGDFEQDVVYMNEGGRDTTKEAINLAKRKFPFDWSQLPPSSSLFQQQQALFVKDPTTSAAPFTEETFVNIDSKKVLPPDGSLDDDQLKMYQPKPTADLNAVDGKSVNELIQNIYGSKGFVAKVAEKNNNVFEVYELQEKNPKIVWEDEVQASAQSNELASKVEPSQMLVTPDIVQDVQNDLMPFVRGESTGMKRSSYSDYNPNLEGIFGPKMQWQQWG